MKKISTKATTTDVLTSRLQNYFGNAFAHKLMISHDRIFDVNVVYAGNQTFNTEVVYMIYRTLKGAR